MTKQTLRKEIQAQRAALSPALWQQKSDIIRQQLLKSKAYHTAKIIFTYISIQNEVDTRSILHAAWTDGKQVAVPVCAADGQMDFVRITAQTPLHKAKHGTLEPSRTDATILYPSADDLYLVPGLVFDTKGNRYGYGGGFYDRYLALHAHTIPTALCFAFQVSDTPLTAQAHDIPMAQLLTENGWQTCG